MPGDGAAASWAVPGLSPHRRPVCAARLALAQGMRDSWLQVFSHCGTAEAILILSTLECPGPGVAETLDSSPSYAQLNAKERK